MFDRNVLTRKLELFGSLSQVDRNLLDRIVARPYDVEARTTLIAEGDTPDHVFLVMNGMACRSKTLVEGNRQIFAYLLPGDLCDLHVFILRAMDHDICTISPSTIVEIPRAVVLEMLNRPALARALWWANLVDEATLREWIVNIGQREADIRLLHLFCELHLRLQSVGLAGSDSFHLPITQMELADTMGISAVHMNRALQSLKARGLIEMKRHELVLNDISELRRIAEFNPNYLHLGGRNTDLGRDRNVLIRR